MLPFFVIALLSLAAVLLKKLTPAGGVAGAFVAACLYLCVGVAGLALLGVFFVTGTMATSWRGKWKAQLGLREKNSGGRDAVQVFANGGVAAAAGLVAWIISLKAEPARSLSAITPSTWAAAAAGALSAATADTLACELGNVYGKHYIDLRTLRIGTRGQDGVISFEGTMIGIIGSFIIGAIFCLTYSDSVSSIGVIVLAGTVGNLLDSALGATLQREGYLSNDAVNFFNTLAGACIALLLYSG